MKLENLSLKIRLGDKKHILHKYLTSIIMAAIRELMKHAADSRLFLFLKCKASFCNSVILP
jgi:hypothetical protein